MIASMTGFGHAQAGRDGITVGVEVRTVNSRFLETSFRLPRSLSAREGEIRELVRKRLTRGKVMLGSTVERDSTSELPVTINPSAARAYYVMLKELASAVGLRETVKLDHLLRFSDVLETRETVDADETEWALFQEALDGALHALMAMRLQEGGELAKDFRMRIGLLEQSLGRVEDLARTQVPAERDRLRERVRELLEGRPVDDTRLEMELVLLADRLDVTEELVRFRSHNKFFLEAVDGPEAAGRRLNFLIQEMNREANTIGSKSASAEIAHVIVGVKEELERVREQIQNIE